MTNFTYAMLVLVMQLAPHRSGRSRHDFLLKPPHPLCRIGYPTPLGGAGRSTSAFSSMAARTLPRTKTYPPSPASLHQRREYRIL